MTSQSKDSRQTKLMGNRNAVKPPPLRRTSMLQIPVTPKEKAALVKAAGGEKLAAYLRRRLRID